MQWRIISYFQTQRYDWTSSNRLGSQESDPWWKWFLDTSPPWSVSPVRGNSSRGWGQTCAISLAPTICNCVFWVGSSFSVGIWSAIGYIYWWQLRAGLLLCSFQVKNPPALASFFCSFPVAPKPVRLWRNSIRLKKIQTSDMNNWWAAELVTQ